MPRHIKLRRRWRRFRRAASGYFPIAEHGIVGDPRSAALVGTDGTIDRTARSASTDRACSERCWIVPAAASNDPGLHAGR
jgi:hypothetical protein